MSSKCNNALYKHFLLDLGPFLLNMLLKMVID